MFFLHSRNGLSEWVRPNMGEWESVAIATVFIFPKQISTLAISFTISKIHFTGLYSRSWDEREVRVFNGRTAPPKYLSLFSFYSNIQPPDLQICSIFSHYCRFFIFTSCLSHVHADREISFQILSDFSWFSIYYFLPSSLLLSVLPRKAMYGFLFDSACQSDSFKQGRKAYKRKKKSTADLPRAAVLVPCTRHTKKS